MEGYKKRLLIEERELNDKFEKLINFERGDKFDELDWVDRDLMYRQGLVMQLYLGFLRERICRALSDVDWDEARKEGLAPNWDADDEEDEEACGDDSQEHTKIKHTGC